MPNSLVIRRDGLDGLMKGIRALTKNEVLVGVPAAKADRPPEEGQDDPVTNATLAYIHETGSPARNIPARPFLVPGIDSAKDAIAAQMKRTGQAVLSTSSQEQAATLVDQGMHATGLIGQGAVQRKLTDGPFQALSDVTLARRRAKGRTGTSPLIDTGALRQAISYVVRPKGQGDG